MYLLSIQSESQLFDLVAYSGYKFVGVIATLAIAEMWNRGGGTGGWVGWTIFAYTFLANAFFLVSSFLFLPYFPSLSLVNAMDFVLTIPKLRSLRYVLLPDSSPNSSSAGSYTANRTQKSRRTQFLFGYSYILQLFLMWFLTMPDRSVKG